MLNIFNNHLSQNHLSFSSSSASSLNSLTTLPEAKQAFFKATAKSGIILAFFALTAFLWLGLVAMAFLGNVKIGKGEVSEEGQRGNLLTEGSFVASWFRKAKREEVDV